MFIFLSNEVNFMIEKIKNFCHDYNYNFVEGCNGIKCDNALKCLQDLCTYIILQVLVIMLESVLNH